jgi:hypothetical protein
MPLFHRTRDAPVAEAPRFALIVGAVMSTWAADEFAMADLGDGRLNRRLIKLADRLADKPTASIPGACGDWAETQGAYRFLSQKKVTWEKILGSHMASTEARLRQHPVALCLQDTTELDFNGQEICGLGPLSYESQRGMYLHPTYVVTPAREPLGVTDAWIWAREPKDADGHRPGPLESNRWIEGYERIAEMAERVPETRLVYVADREADILRLMRRALALGNPADWLIRSQHNRSLPDGAKLWDTVLAGTPLGEIQFTLASRHGQPAREVRQEVWAYRLVLPAGEGEALPVTCLVAREVNSPKGVKPVEWRLLTNREAGSLEAAAELIDWYRARWEIEMFFNVLKNGCRVETLQLAAIGKIELALAVYMVVAWRLQRMMRLGRTHPNLDAALLFSTEEWQAAYILAKKPVPKTPPCARDVIRRIAGLGGFLGRKGDGEPGVKTLWLGWQRVRDFVEGLEYAKKVHAR